jgi:branched-chain amino acid transport system permease protein
MLTAILVTGLAMGAIYAMVGLAYNIMYSTSKVMSFTAGQLGMLGAVLGAWFVGVLGWPLWLGFPAAMAGGVLFGYATERIAVRPVLKSIEQHVYVLTTLALALMVQQAAAILWGTEPRPFPSLFGTGGGGFADEKYWLPMVTCIVILVALELFYRRTLWGRAFIAVSEDAVAARALGLPDQKIRVASYCLAAFVGALAGFTGGQLLHAFFALGATLTFYGFVPIAIGGLGSNRGALIGGIALGILQQVANYFVGGLFVGIVTFAIFIAVLLLMPQGIYGTAVTRRV